MLKRVISMVMVLCMVLSLMPQIVWAETGDGFTPDEYIPMQVNPLYAGVLDQEELEKHVPKTYAVEPRDTKYVSRDEAVQQIRDYMKQRVESFTIYVEKDPNADTSANGMFESALDHTGVPTEGDYLAWQYGSWSASGGSNALGRRVNYSMTYYDTAEQQKKMDKAVDDLLDDLDLEGLTDYEKIWGVYDYMTENIVYDYEHLGDNSYMLQYTAYAALVNGTSVCQGYANLFYRLALELDVDARIVVGWGNGGPHAWNIVELGDKYYCLDATWDASWAQAGWGYQYFLRGTSYFGDHVVDTSISSFYTDYKVSTTDYGSDVEPEEPDVPDVDYRCGDNLTWELSSDGVLTISGTGEMWDYPYEYPGWYPYVSQIRKCVIEEGVTDIGEYVFYACYALEEIQIPDSVTAIGFQAFAECTSLTSLELPDSVQAIGSYAFENCINLSSLEIPEGVLSLSYGVFLNCKRLQSVAIPESVTTIEMYAFEDCTNLEKVYYGGSPSEWNRITIESFNECLSSADIICAEADQELPDPGTGCGMDEDAITQILWSMKSQYPEGMTWNGQNSYHWNINNTIGYGCAAFAFILSDEVFGYLPSRKISSGFSIDMLRPGDIIRMNNDSHSAVVLEVHDDYVVLAEGSYNNSVHWGRHYTAQQVVQDTTYVYTRYPEHSFLDGVCTECGAVEPAPQAREGRCGNDLYWSLSDEGVLTISGTGKMWDYPEDYPGWYQYVDDVRTCVIEEGVTSVGNFAFYDCTSLEAVEFPGTLDTIGDGAFYCCPLIQVEIPEGVTSIGMGAFYYCPRLASVKIPASVTFVGDNAFYNCYALTDIYYAGTQAQWEQIEVADGFGYLEDVTIHYAQEESESLCGDCNGDGRVNGMDLILLRQYLAGWDVSVDQTAAECNGDGRVNSMDLILLRQYLSGWDVTLG